MNGNQLCEICQEAARRPHAAGPVIPSWLRVNPSPTRYTSIYELCPNETRVYGTESLYGDWNGRLLVLAKDFAPRTVVESRMALDARPYRAGCPCKDRELRMGQRTNLRLVRFARRIEAGILYGSVLGGLLRNDGETSGALPAPSAIEPYAQKLVRFTIAQMPSVEVVACLGVEAWLATLAGLNVERTERKRVPADRQPLLVGGLALFAMRHPSRGANADHEADWAAVDQHLQRRVTRA